MAKPSLCFGLAILLAGCAEERIVEASKDYYQAIDGLGEQEVINNIDATIDNPYRIPTRTTFGKGNLTFTDNAQASVSVPLHLFSKTAGSAGANAGTYTNSYQIAINPETDSDTLEALRDVYRALLYPKFKSPVPIPGGAGEWVYWTNLDGTASTRPPPPGAVSVGRGRTHEIFVTNLESYNKFILVTFGSTPAKADDRTFVATGRSSGRTNVLRQSAAGGGVSGQGKKPLARNGGDSGSGISQRVLPSRIPQRPPTTDNQPNLQTNPVP